ncbi:MAG TPA: RND transporter, partial [Caulobacteraceae bacterium]|nr:RND transporter [Caulobacteraceae bacterium]
MALVLLGGCRSLAPPHVVPEMPVPPAYPEEYAGGEAGTRATAIGWRDFFADPRLAALVDAALAGNRDLAVAVAQIEQARGLYRIQES